MLRNICLNDINSLVFNVRLFSLRRKIFEKTGHFHSVICFYFYRLPFILLIVFGSVFLICFVSYILFVIICVFFFSFFVIIDCYTEAYLCVCLCVFGKFIFCLFNFSWCELNVIISFGFNKSDDIETEILLAAFLFLLYLYTVRCVCVLTSYFSTCLKADVIRFSPAVCWTSCCFIWIAKQMIHTQTVIRQWFWVFFLSKTIYSVHHHHHHRLPDRPARCPDKLEGRWSISMPAEM